MAIREFSGCEDMECRLQRGAGTVGALAALVSDYGDIVSVHASQALELTGCRTANPVLLLPLTEGAEIAPRDGAWQVLDRLVVARPDEGLRLSLPENGRLMLLRPAEGILDGLLGTTGEGVMFALESMIRCHLYRSRFFRHDAHARELTDELFRQMTRVVAMETIPPCDCSGIDPRLLRAVNKIKREPGWDFNLKELASHSGVSERNLYYLMKRETGMTPYRLYQRHRLMRVRHQLVDCQCDVPHISWYAADAGFSHLGRFAALYREHFGELPSETVQWRRNLQRREPDNAADLALG